MKSRESSTGLVSVRLFFSLSLCFLLAACTTADSYLSRGNALAGKGQYEEAILNYQKALQKQPQFGEAVYRMAFAHHKLGKTMEAFQLLKQAIGLAPSSETYRVALADMALSGYLGDAKRPAFLYDEIAAQAKALGALPKGKADALRLNGFLAASEKKPEEAIRLFRQSLALAPNGGVSVALASLLFEDKQEAEAIALLDKLIAAEPKDQAAYGTLYNYYVSRDREPEALATLEKQIQGDRANAAGLINLALHHARRKREPEMRAALQRVLDGKYPQAYGQVGDFYAMTGKPEEALRWYDDGIRLLPADKAEYLKRKAVLLGRLGRAGEARALLDSVLAASPNDEAVAAMKAGLALEPGGDTAAAAGEFQKLTAARPGNAQYHYQYARALLAQGNAAAARKALATALGLQPGLIPAHELQIEAMLAQRAYTDVHGALDVMAQAVPDHPRLPLWRAAAYRGQGNLAPAREQLDMALRQAPDDPAVILQNGLLLMLEKRNAEADAAFRKLYAPGQGDPRALAGLVTNQLAQKKFAEAVALFKPELERNASPGLRQVYAETLARAGRLDESLAEYRGLLGQNPKALARAQAAEAARIQALLKKLS